MTANTFACVLPHAGARLERNNAHQTRGPGKSRGRGFFGFLFRCGGGFLHPADNQDGDCCAEQGGRFAACRVQQQIAHVGQRYIEGLNAGGGWLNEERLQIICRCSIAAEMELIEHYASGSCAFSAEELAELGERLTLQMVSVPEREILRVLQRSRECAAPYCMEMYAPFAIRLRRREAGAESN